MTDKNDLIAGFDDIQMAPREEKKKPFLGFGKKEEKEKTPVMFWCNVGLRRGGKLISLPNGIALDKSSPIRIPSGPKADATPEEREKALDFLQLQLTRKKLWEKVQKDMQSLKPGETMTLPFEVEIRRVKETELTEEEAGMENKYSIDDFLNPTPAEAAPAQ